MTVIEDTREILGIRYCVKCKDKYGYVTESCDKWREIIVDSKHLGNAVRIQCDFFEELS